MITPDWKLSYQEWSVGTLDKLYVGTPRRRSFEFLEKVSRRSNGNSDWIVPRLYCCAILKRRHAGMWEQVARLDVRRQPGSKSWTEIRVCINPIRVSKAKILAIVFFRIAVSLENQSSSNRDSNSESKRGYVLFLSFFFVETEGTHSPFRNNLRLSLCMALLL